MAPPPANPSAARKAPAINRINKTTFLARSLPNLESHIVSVPSPGSTELDILNLSDLLVSCATSAKVKSSIAVNSKNMPWWTPELCALRTKARTAFKSWSRSLAINGRCGGSNAKRGRTSVDVRHLATPLKRLRNSLERPNPSLFLLSLLLTAFLHLILQSLLKGVPTIFFLVKNQLILCMPALSKPLVSL